MCQWSTVHAVSTAPILHQAQTTYHSSHIIKSCKNLHIRCTAHGSYRQNDAMWQKYGKSVPLLVPGEWIQLLLAATSAAQETKIWERQWTVSRTADLSESCDVNKTKITELEKETIELETMTKTTEFETKTIKLETKTTEFEENDTTQDQDQDLKLKTNQDQDRQCQTTGTLSLNWHTCSSVFVCRILPSFSRSASMFCAWSLCESPCSDKTSRQDQDHNLRTTSLSDSK